ncbi:MAG: CoA-binding protein [Candidatus Heimdallarchaeota archaeon]|nr:CoA-binding protein [Candidatus Heimdallarchaeota archaeon]
MNADSNSIKQFLKNKGKIAIVGASTNSAKAGNYVPQYLKSIGFDLIPINPMVEELFGVPTLKDLSALNEDVTGVIIYRKPEIAEKVGLEAIQKGIPLIWLPEGVTSSILPERCQEAGIIYIEDRCPLKEGRALL